MSQIRMFNLENVYEEVITVDIRDGDGVEDILGRIWNEGGFLKIRKSRLAELFSEWESKDIKSVIVVLSEKLSEVLFEEDLYAVEKLYEELEKRTNFIHFFTDPYSFEEEGYKGNFPGNWLAVDKFLEVVCEHLSTNEEEGEAYIYVAGFPFDFTSSTSIDSRGSFFVSFPEGEVVLGENKGIIAGSRDFLKYGKKSCALFSLHVKDRKIVFHRENNECVIEVDKKHLSAHLRKQGKFELIYNIVKKEPLNITINSGAGKPVKVCIQVNPKKFKERSGKDEELQEMQKDTVEQISPSQQTIEEGKYQLRLKRINLIQSKHFEKTLNLNLVERNNKLWLLGGLLDQNDREEANYDVLASITVNMEKELLTITPAEEKTLFYEETREGVRIFLSAQNEEESFKEQNEDSTDPEKTDNEKEEAIINSEEYTEPEREEESGEQQESGNKSKKLQRKKLSSEISFSFRDGKSFSVVFGETGDCKLIVREKFVSIFYAGNGREIVTFNRQLSFGRYEANSDAEGVLEGLFDGSFFDIAEGARDGKKKIETLVSRGDESKGHFYIFIEDEGKVRIENNSSSVKVSIDKGKWGYDVIEYRNYQEYKLSEFLERNYSLVVGTAKQSPRVVFTLGFRDE